MTTMKFIAAIALAASVATYAGEANIKVAAIESSTTTATGVAQISSPDGSVTLRYYVKASDCKAGTGLILWKDEASGLSGQRTFILGGYAALDGIASHLCTTGARQQMAEAKARNGNAAAVDAGSAWITLK